MEHILVDENYIPSKNTTPTLPIDSKEQEKTDKIIQVL